jgi:hypothetical protein
MCLRAGCLFAVNLFVLTILFCFLSLLNQSFSGLSCKPCEILEIVEVPSISADIIKSMLFVRTNKTLIKKQV